MRDSLQFQSMKMNCKTYGRFAMKYLAEKILLNVLRIKRNRLLKVFLLQIWWLVFTNIYYAFKKAINSRFWEFLEVLRDSRILITTQKDYGEILIVNLRLRKVRKHLQDRKSTRLNSSHV